MENGENKGRPNRTPRQWTVIDMVGKTHIVQGATATAKDGGIRLYRGEEIVGFFPQIIAALADAEPWLTTLVALCDAKAPELVKWLTSPHPMLGDRTALAAIVDGDEEKVRQLVAQLADGAYV